MDEIEIPDNEDAACDLGDIEIMFARKGHYNTAGMISGAARRLRADAAEIARLTAERDAERAGRERAERVARLHGAQSTIDDVLRGLRSENNSQQLRAIIASVEWMRADIDRALIKACEGGRDDG